MVTIAPCFTVTSGGYQLVCGQYTSWNCSMKNLCRCLITVSTQRYSSAPRSASLTYRRENRRDYSALHYRSGYDHHALNVLYNCQRGSYRFRCDPAVNETMEAGLAPPLYGPPRSAKPVVGDMPFVDANSHLIPTKNYCRPRHQRSAG